MTWFEWQEKHFPDVALVTPICPQFSMMPNERPCNNIEYAVNGRDPCWDCRNQEMPKMFEGGEINGDDIGKHVKGDDGVY